MGQSSTDSLSSAAPQIERSHRRIPRIVRRPALESIQPDTPLCPAQRTAEAAAVDRRWISSGTSPSVSLGSAARAMAWARRRCARSRCPGLAIREGA
eukprot:CAMPEP_0205885652 /NCGR_PEP_ID=MMETSP1083-20121108/18795_1 /ASSEMBLY_ACC=CAM_ASM_000430 /TAXON_ID=97485 /ORGANISM="Prymnesium parvum, Strain Texoma1" /LENGTH=96 /DNA_ID=CAMNT_0053249193 /DNA_START=40 /DNA_END=326 /DNA_ORIENTATION=-